MEQEELLRLRGQSELYQKQIQEITQKALVHRDEYFKVEEEIVSKKKELEHARKHFPPSIYMVTPTGVIERELDTLNLHLQEHEKQILRYQEQVKIIEEAYYENEKEVTKTANWLSPFYSLPVELHRYIFQLCQAPPHASQPIWYPLGDGKNGHVPPIQVLISQVSVRFRDIVQDSPELWTNMKVDISEEGSLDKLRAYLTRSTTHTICVTFCATKDVSNEQLRLAWAPLIPHIGRIGSLNLNFLDGTALAFIMKTLKYECVPRLTAFKAQCRFESRLVPGSGPMLFSNPPQRALGQSHEPFTCFLKGPGPALETLECENALPGVTSWNSGVLRMRVKMPQRSLKPGHWLSESVLASFSGLIALSLEECCYFQTMDSAKSFALPHLCYLKITARLSPTTTLFLESFFNFVKMPELESLSVSCFFGVDIAELFYILSKEPSRQQFPKLRMLSFLCPKLPLDITLPVRRPRKEKNACISNPFEHVEQVAFAGLYQTDGLLAHLFSPEIYGIPRLPNIKLLSVGGDYDDLKLETLKSIVTSRITDKCPIPRIEVDESSIRSLWGPEIQWFFRTNVELYSFDEKKFFERLESVCFPPLESLR